MIKSLVYSIANLSIGEVTAKPFAAQDLSNFSNLCSANRF